MGCNLSLRLASFLSTRANERSNPIGLLFSFVGGATLEKTVLRKRSLAESGSHLPSQSASFNDANGYLAVVFDILLSLTIVAVPLFFAISAALFYRNYTLKMTLKNGKVDFLAFVFHIWFGMLCGWF